MKIEKKKISELKPAPYNPRVDIKENKYFYEKLYRSIKQFGLVEPIVWNKRTGHVVGGNQRLQILKDEGVEEVDVVVVDLPLEEEKALNIALNKIVGDWDREKLASVLNELNDIDDFLIQLSGFDEKELNSIIDSYREVEEDDFDVDAALEHEPKYKIKRGDVYQLGNHRLMCGDATNPDDVSRLMDGKKADMVFTSPPNRVGKQYEYQKSIEEINEFIKNTCINLKNSVKKDFSRIIINTWTGNGKQYTGKVETLLLIDKWIYYLKPEWLMRHLRFWIKTGGLPAPIPPKNDMIDQHCEFIATFYNIYGEQRGQNRINEKWVLQGFIDDIKGEASSEGHCAAFPVELPSRFIRLYSLEKEIILDPFGGSGTTLIACEQLNRICYMMEIDPVYCSVIIERWEKLTGKKAEYVGNYG